MDLPYAHECYFWKTSKSGTESWLEKTKRMLINAGGTHIFESYGNDVQSGRAAFMLAFMIGEEKFKLVWPVLPVRSKGDETAAKRQAATMLYHDVKNKCIKATVFGARTAFFEYLMIPDGRSLSELANNELLNCIPDNLLDHKK